MLRKLWRNSQTEIWAYTQGASAAVIGVISNVSEVTHSAEFKEVLGTFSNIPWWVPTGIAVMGLISYIAHGHRDA